MILNCSVTTLTNIGRSGAGKIAADVSVLLEAVVTAWNDVSVGLRGHGWKESITDSRGRRQTAPHWHHPARIIPGVRYAVSLHSFNSIQACSAFAAQVWCSNCLYDNLLSL